MMQRKTKMFTINKNNSGFSLMELMVVMAIISILAGIAIKSFVATRTRAGDAAAFSETNALGKAVLNAFLDGIDFDFFPLVGGGPEIGALDTSGNGRKPIYILGKGLKATVVGDSNLGQCDGWVWYGNSTNSYNFSIDVEQGLNSFPTS